ncbi:glycine oxidase ThiO [Rubidibacter lacunae KORDI 51-2]|uniref:Thiazole synthase n=1 Tax=Rubidibacter lacunae KORDI 51-2 TaxID=582515 RepID=U5DPN6_9CHRO|nr:glycine oxidase ThiO [Rubidibacter lacunae]ERN41655.1 glycine oxidase ThiO [Rubidibacter lacunae KORDI 51-2]
MSDAIIIGGGIMGVAIALELRLRGARAVVLSRNPQQAATRAAAGMIAPQAEKIPPSPLLDLCLESRARYPEWIRNLESIAGSETGYWPCGILAPVLEAPHEPRSTDTATWLDRPTLDLYQPGLGPDVVGGWWYPEDAQVDAAKLFATLQQAARAKGVEIREGIRALGFLRRQGKVVGVRTSAGDFAAEYYVLAAGAWSHEMLPVPVRPVKGQMLALRMPRVEQLPIQRVLFGPDSAYLVPRCDGRLVVGATVEDVGWQPNITPTGVRCLLDRAEQLYPGISNWGLEQMWWGYRPTTPDELPILGVGPCQNLILATGHHRNGILLAPVTAGAIADLIVRQHTHPLLEPFRWDRFQSAAQFQLVVGRGTANTKNGHQNGNGTRKVLSSATPAAPLAVPQAIAPLPQEKPLTIAGRAFRSRLMTGSGKYPTLKLMRQSIVASGCEIVTVAVRRVQAKAPGHEGLAEALDWSRLWMLPNTAGCQSAEEAVRVARLGREMAKLLGQEDNNFVKLEVIADLKYLLPDPIGTLQAAEQLVKEGFAVLPYINADPQLAKRLEAIGCATVMPLGSPIGSGQGIRNAANIEIIAAESEVPVIVDAGIGTPSEAAYAMELGADGLLVNSAIALAENPVAMARAMGQATESGYLARHAGRIPVKHEAIASSPLTGKVGS